MVTIKKVNNRKKETYELDYYDDKGKRVRKMLYVDEKTAKRIRKEIEIKIERIKLGLEKPQLVSPFLKHFIIEYLKYREYSKSPATVKRDKFALDRFLKYSGDIQISKINPRLIDIYTIQMNTSLRIATIGIELRHLKVAFNTAKRWNYLLKKSTRRN